MPGELDICRSWSSTRRWHRFVLPEVRTSIFTAALAVDHPSQRPAPAQPDDPERVEQGGGEPPPHALNLIGLPRVAEREELLDLLRSFGVTINVLFPDADRETLALLPLAEHTVLFPEQHLNELYDELLAGVSGTQLALPAPYGLDASYRWCRAIAESLGLVRAFEQQWTGWKDAARDRLDAVTVDAIDRSIAFVGSAAELRALADPLQCQGVALFDVLAEIGFGVQWLEHQATDSGPRPPFDPTATFSDPGELAEVLGACESGIVYSDIAGDSRIARAGKTPVSLSAFRLGPEGYLRTAEHLLAGCQLGFYQRYREYLP